MIPKVPLIYITAPNLGQEIFQYIGNMILHIHRTTQSYSFPAKDEGKFAV
jgi:hypothetical protein